MHIAMAKSVGKEKKAIEIESTLSETEKLLVDSFNQLRFERVHSATSSLDPQLIDMVDKLWMQYGYKIFRRKLDFVNWLSVPNIGLSYTKPIDIIREDFGKVEDLLGRITYGILA